MFSSFFRTVVTNRRIADIVQLREHSQRVHVGQPKIQDYDIGILGDSQFRDSLACACNNRPAVARLNLY